MKRYSHTAFGSVFTIGGSVPVMQTAIDITQFLGGYFTPQEVAL